MINNIHIYVYTYFTDSCACNIVALQLLINPSRRRRRYVCFGRVCLHTSFCSLPSLLFSLRSQHVALNSFSLPDEPSILITQWLDAYFHQPNRFLCSQILIIWSMHLAKSELENKKRCTSS